MVSSLALEVGRCTESKSTCRPMSTNTKPYIFHPGDKVRLLHRGHPTGRIAVVREVQDNGCLLADFIDKAPDEFPVYDYADQFVLAS